MPPNLGNSVSLNAGRSAKLVEAANGQPQDLARRVMTDEAIVHGLQHVFERHSVAPQHHILEAALVKGCGQLNLEQLKKELAERPELVRVGSEFSTRDILTKELFLIRTVNAGVEAIAPVARRYAAVTRQGLSPCKRHQASLGAHDGKKVRCK